MERDQIYKWIRLKKAAPNNAYKIKRAVGLQAVHPASAFVTGDTDAAPQPASFHIRDR